MSFFIRILKALSVVLAISAALSSFAQTSNGQQLDFDDLHSRASAGMPMTCSEIETVMVIYIAGSWPEVAESVGYDIGIDPTEWTLEKRRMFFGFLESVAERGHIPAMLVLSNAYADGAPGLPENDRLAYEWALRTAKLGSVDGMLFVAASSFFGDGTERDIQRAYRWALIAEAQAFGNENASITDGNKISTTDIKEEVRQFLSFEQIQQAQDEAADWTVEQQTPYCLDDVGASLN